jgi:uncharacterized protein (DUF3084 family)
MSSLPLLFLILIVAMGGVIAFFADRLGRKLGKKRLSLFGLRPRHTAEALTVGAGVLIPLLTIVFLYTVSAEIRKWIQEGPNAIRQRDNLLGDLKKLDKQYQEKSALVAKLDKDVLDLRTSRDKVQGDLDKTKDELSKTLLQRDRVAAQASRLQGQLAALNRTLSERQRLYAEVKRSLADKTRQLAIAAKAKGQLDASLAKVQDDFRRLMEDVRQQGVRERELDREVQRLETERDRRQSDIDQLKAEKKDLDIRLEQAKAAVEQYQSDLADAAHELELKQQEKERLNVALGTNVTVTRTKRLLVPMGTELARVTLKPHETVASARAALQALISESRETAAQGGIVPSVPGEPAAGLRDLPDGENHRITVDEQTAAITKAVTNLPEESVLVAYALWNVFEGESVPLQVRPFRNPMVYKEGEVIAETRIDGRQTETDILKQINTFLLTAVRDRARKDRMIPNGAEGSYGTISNEQMFPLVQELKDKNIRVRLQAVVKKDTRAADPLELFFRIKP